MITVYNIASKQERFYKFVTNPIHNIDAARIEISQGKFLRELDPNAHLILDPVYYPDIQKEVPVDEKKPDGEKMTVTKHVERVSIPFQKMIKSKRLTFLAGNPMNFDIMEVSPTEDQISQYVKYKQKWILYNFDTAIYEFLNSVEGTGDGAIALFLNENKETDYRVMSILNRDMLHPIFDYTGKLRIFGRSFTNYDQGSDNQSFDYMEIWDDKYYYLFSTNADLENENIPYPEWDDINDYKLNGVDRTDAERWFLVSRSEHGFNEIPVVYCKNEEGACWSDVQPLIDSLEKALSELFENNKSYAFRIMYIQGGFQIQTHKKDNNAKDPSVILLDDANAKVGTVEGTDASNSFKEQLNQTLSMLKMGAFIVTPPENVSGDTSGTAIKILYAPAIEKALNEIHFFTPSIKKINGLFKESISKEKDMSPSTLNTVHVRAYQKPFIPQNDTEVVNCLNVAYSGGNGYLSADTCQEKDPNSTPQEAMRIKKQKEEIASDERNAIVGSSVDNSNTTTATVDENGNPLNERNATRKNLKIASK